jgi:hypothetical protein
MKADPDGKRGASAGRITAHRRVFVGPGSVGHEQCMGTVHLGIVEALIFSFVRMQIDHKLIALYRRQTSGTIHGNCGSDTPI